MQQWQEHSTKQRRGHKRECATSNAYIETREVGKDLRELLVEVLARELDFARVEGADTLDVPTLVADRRRLALRLGQDDVQKLCARG